MFSAVSASPTNVIRNAWALGDDNAGGCPGNINDSWNHNQEMSLSRCSKNPAPPLGLTQGGAAFKCGPTMGQCSPNTLGESWQDFNAQERGVPLASSYSVSFKSLIICVGCTFVKAELLGSSDGGQTWINLGTLLNFIPKQSVPCNTLTFWDTYCGNTIVVPHYELYRLYVSGMYKQQSGYKFTGVDLSFEPYEVEETPTPTPTLEMTPTATSEPTATATQLPPTATPSPTAVGTPLWCTKRPLWPGCN